MTSKKMTPKRRLLLTAAGATLAITVSGLSPTFAGQKPDRHDRGYDDLTQVAPLSGPRGVDALGRGRTLVTEGDGSFSLVVERKHRPAKVIRLGSLGGGFAPAIALGKKGTVWLLTAAGGPPPEEEMRKLSGDKPEPVPAAGATLFKWRHGWHKPKAVADIGAYQATDPDPDDQEGEPLTSNPFGLAAVPRGGVLVADAEGNDLLRVFENGKIKTVARLKPRQVEVPGGLPDIPAEEGGPLPPAGTPIMSEAVATSVTVGRDGYWYVGELRGFPATPGTSQIWRIRPGTFGATCDPEKPYAGRCKRYADGLTSIVDLAPARKGILAVSLSKKSWFQMELGVPGSEIGGLFSVSRRGTHELVPDQLVLPAGVDATWREIYVTAPLFGPGALWKVH